MKNLYEGIAQAMYEAYDEERYKGGPFASQELLFSDIGKAQQDGWIAAAKEAAKQFGVITTKET